MKPLIFSTKVGKQKPQHMSTAEEGCPFCPYRDKENLLRVDGELIWTLNKYPTLDDTLQTVLIETAQHNADIRQYSQADNRRLFRFGVECFREMQQQDFRSVLFYKNHGPVSGGSLKHPHMQIVGLKQIDGYQEVEPSNFEGVEVLADGQVRITLSTEPIMGFLEINIQNQADDASFDRWADLIQLTVRYILDTYFDGRCDSYNLFLYDEENLTAKLVPRFVTSPYFVGYKLAQRFTDKRLGEVKQELLEQFSK